MQNLNSNLPSGEQVERAWGHSNGSDVGRVRTKRVQVATAPDVVERTSRVLVAGDQQTAGGIDTHRRHRGALSR